METSKRRQIPTTNAYLNFSFRGIRKLAQRRFVWQFRYVFSWRTSVTFINCPIVSRNPARHTVRAGLRYDILFILRYQVSTAVMDLVVVFALFEFLLALLCFWCYRMFGEYIYINNDICRQDLYLVFLRSSSQLLPHAAVLVCGLTSDWLLLWAASSRTCLHTLSVISVAASLSSSRHQTLIAHFHSLTSTRQFYASVRLYAKEAHKWSTFAVCDSVRMSVAAGIAEKNNGLTVDVSVLMTSYQPTESRLFCMFPFSRNWHTSFPVA